MNVTTIGIGDGINTARLQDVDLDGSGSPISVANFDDLIATLLNTVIGGDVSGNVILGNNNALGGGDDDAFGADGGRIESVTINNITYVWNGTNVIDPSGPGANIAGNQLTGIATAAGGKLTFNFATGAWSYTAPINGVSANTTETFAYTLIDGDGDHANANLQVTVLNVNNAPVNTVPGAQSTNEDVSKVITGLSVADSDAGSGSITVTLSVTNGILNVVGGTATIAGSGTATVTLTGTLAAINSTLAAANAVTYVPTGNYNGSATLTMVTNDNGSTGAGGALSDTDNVAITVNAVNDPAVITGPTTGTVTEAGGVNNAVPGTPTATGNLQSTDVDNTNDSWTVVAAGTATTNGYGTFGVTAAGVWTYTLNNSNASVQALNVGGTLSDTFTVTTVDGTAQLVSITINGSNDAPQLALDSTQNVRDEFGTAAYNNNGPNNTANWSGNWTETDDNNNATSGEIQITGGVLDFDGDIDGGETLSRAVNLTGATSATLTFDYVEGNDSGENIVVEAWNGSSWDVLGTIQGSATDDSGAFSESRLQLRSGPTRRFGSGLRATGIRRAQTTLSGSTTSTSPTPRPKAAKPLPSPRTGPPSASPAPTVSSAMSTAQTWCWRRSR